MKHLLPIFCFFYACISVLGEDAPDQNVRTRFTGLLPSTFPHDKTKPLPQHTDDPPWELQFDVSEYLTSSGIKWLPHEDAIYQPASRVLVVRARPAILDEVGVILGVYGCAGNGRSALRVEVALVEFASAKAPELSGDVPYEEMRKAAGDSWHVLNRSVVTTRSNERTVVISKSAPSEEKADTTVAKDNLNPEDKIEPLLDGEYGTTFEVNPSLGPDRRTALVDLSYHYRVRGPEAMFWEATMSADVTVAVPTVLQLNSAPRRADASTPAKLRALILRVDAIYDYAVDPKPGTQAVGPAARPAPRP